MCEIEDSSWEGTVPQSGGKAVLVVLTASNNLGHSHISLQVELRPERRGAISQAGKAPVVDYPKWTLQFQRETGQPVAPASSSEHEPLRGSTQGPALQLQRRQAPAGRRRWDGLVLPIGCCWRQRLSSAPLSIACVENVRTADRTISIFNNERANL